MALADCCPQCAAPEAGLFGYPCYMVTMNFMAQLLIKSYCLIIGSVQYFSVLIHVGKGHIVDAI
jgi:hypothetical protein